MKHFNMNVPSALVSKSDETQATLKLAWSTVNIFHMALKSIFGFEGKVTEAAHKFSIIPMGVFVSQKVILP